MAVPCCDANLFEWQLCHLACACRNVLHWHILDSSSFPVKSLKFPQLSAKGAYSPAATYSLDELRELVEFAKGRGVRIVVEIEMPGHGSFSAGMPELSLTSCDDVLDPTKDSTYKFLGDFLQEMTTVFTDSLLYLGGDEVGFDPKCKWPGTSKCGYHCFDRDPAVAAWMKTQGSMFRPRVLTVRRKVLTNTKHSI